MKNLNKLAIALVLTLALITVTGVCFSQTITKTHHAELAVNVDSSYISGMKKLGFSYRYEVNSKKQLIVVFTKVVIKP